MNENELKHYGVKGMKWGVRRSRSQSKTYNEAKKEYDRNKDLVRNYTKESKRVKSPSRNKYYKSLVESNSALTKKTEDYLKSLDKTKTKSLIKRDEEHGRHYVDAQIFDPGIKYDSFVYVSDEFARRYK